MLLPLQLLNLLEEGGSPTFEAAGYIAGTAVDASGVMGTSFLSDGESVPETAVFIGGFAHTPAGLRYVAAWPASDLVTYVRGIAARNDGAMIIDPAGSVAAYLNGWGLTSRGEVIGTSSAPDLIKAGFGLKHDADVCMSEVA